MKIIDALIKKLSNIGLKDFFYNISEDLVDIGLIVIEPHKMDDNTFYSLVGIMGYEHEGEYTIDIIKEKDFIKIAKMELTILKDSASLTFSINFNSIISYVIYSLLKDKEIEIGELEITAGLGAFLKLIKNAQKIRKKIDRSLEMTKKRLRKSYLAKCNMMKKMTNEEKVLLVDKEINSEYVVPENGWILALDLLSKFIKDLD